ncbi:Detected protein of unknown function [Hibiscus syriacus]|uniref:NB-ARC domain-containing protein n=1 Tax=Hibiscus syriacus TaxID=106335 RepID=A0A6A2YAF5_HIBSY|nr:Detected protein of unknown function [Hibiscus syriacus]
MIFDQHMKDLKRKLKELNGTKKDTESIMRKELQPRKKLKAEVQIWLENVERLNGEVQDLDDRIGESSALTRGFHTEDVSKITKEVEELIIQHGKFHGGLVVDNPQWIGQVLSTISLSGEAVKACVKEIWQCLMDDGVRKIGVWGMGGVGKTSMMKVINNQLLKETGKFEIVIWITVSKEVSIVKLQKDIARRIGVEFSGDEDETTRAGMIFETLSQKGRFVMILDDLWEKEVGGLKKLEILKGRFYDWHNLNMYLQACHGREEPRQYIISVGDVLWHAVGKEVRKDIVVCGGNIYSYQIMLPRGIKGLRIWDCNVDCIEEYPLFSRFILSSIGSFSYLKFLHMYDCGNMRKLFSPDCVPLNLQEFRVIRCEQVEEIIASEVEESRNGYHGISSSTIKDIEVVFSTGIEVLIFLNLIMCHHLHLHMHLHLVENLNEITNGVLSRLCRLQYLVVGETLINGKEVGGLKKLEILKGRF